jgi:hypothetical protein
MREENNTELIKQAYAAFKRADMKTRVTILQ